MGRTPGIVIKIDADPATTKAALEAVREQMQRTAAEGKRDAEGLAEGWKSVRNALGSIGVGLSIGAAVAGMRSLVQESLDLATSLDRAAKKTGLSVESLSVLHYAAKVTGGDFEGMTTALGRFENTIAKGAEGNAQAAAFMRGLGLDAKELSGRADGAEIAFHKFLQTLSATTSPIERNRLAIGLLGRAGSEQIPMLLQLANNWDFFKQKAQDAGVLLTSETAAQLAATNQRLQDIQQHLAGAALALTDGLSPALSQMFSVMTGGRSAMDAMREFGQQFGRVLTGITSESYLAGSAVTALLAAVAGGKFTNTGRNLIAETYDLQRKGNDLWKIGTSDTLSKDGSHPFLPNPGGAGGGGGGFDGAPTGRRGSVKSDNAIPEAAAQLAEEQARLQAELQKSAGEIQLAELENQHKLLLVSDQQFYAEKLRLQTEELDAEEKALKDRQSTLQALYDRQRTDKTLKRDKGGISAEELRTEREMVQLQERLAEVETRRAQVTSANVSEVNASNQAAELANLRAAAELEKQRNQGIEAQIALIRKERELEAQKLTNSGGSSAAAQQIRDLGELEAKQLELGEVQRQISETESGYKLRAAEIEDRANKGLESRRQAEHELNDLHEQEAQALEALVEQYQELADTLGGPFKEKAAELQAELVKLKTPDQKQEAQFGKTLAEGVTRMADTIVAQTLRGRTSFKEMSKEIEIEAARLALKLAAEHFLNPAASGAGGGAAAAGGNFFGKLLSGVVGNIPGFAVGTDNAPGGAALVGEKGPELVNLPRGSSVTPSNVLTKLAETGGGRGAPNVTTNVINQSSQPVSAQPSEVSWDAQIRQLVVHTVLTDHAEGGPIAQAMAGYR